MSESLPVVRSLLLGRGSLLPGEQLRILAPAHELEVLKHKARLLEVELGCELVRFIRRPRTPGGNLCLNTTNCGQFFLIKHYCYTNGRKRLRARWLRGLGLQALGLWCGDSLQDGVLRIWRSLEEVELACQWINEITDGRLTPTPLVRGREKSTAEPRYGLDFRHQRQLLRDLLWSHVHPHQSWRLTGPTPHTAPDQEARASGDPLAFWVPDPLADLDHQAGWEMPSMAPWTPPPPWALADAPEPLLAAPGPLDPTPRYQQYRKGAKSLRRQLRRLPKSWNAMAPEAVLQALRPDLFPPSNSNAQQETPCLR